MNNIAVFISGNGTILKSIIDACNNGTIAFEVKLVISSNDSCNGINIAKDNNIDVVSTNDSSKIIELLKNNNIDFIILAGYLKLLSSKIINKYPKKIINVHPSLLPSFGGVGMYGINVHKAVILAKEKVSGATIHYVDENFDTGEIIDQFVIELDDFETPESLQRKVHKKESELLIKVLKNKQAKIIDKEN